MGEIKLIVLDVDGVIGLGEAQPFDLSLLSRLAGLNRRARQDKKNPAVTLNTGRPSAYVEAIMQAIDAWQPALYENGAGLYSPQSYQFQTSPKLTSEQMARFREILDHIDQNFVQTGQAYWQPGKSICHSLFALPPFSMNQLAKDVEAFVAELSDEFAVKSAILALNIYPKHIHKGTGLQWLAETTGIAPAEMAGVGDSGGDIDFLRLLGYAAAPANAIDEVKQVVHYVSPKTAADGLYDILDYWQL
jgi:HAD superfamily hydrolase (TIGR01484 family)